MHLCKKWHHPLNCWSCTTVFWLLQKKKKKGLALWKSCMKSAFSACLLCFWASPELLWSMSALFTEQGFSWLSSSVSPFVAETLPCQRSLCWIASHNVPCLTWYIKLKLHHDLYASWSSNRSVCSVLDAKCLFLFLASSLYLVSRTSTFFF